MNLISITFNNSSQSDLWTMISSLSTVAYTILTGILVCIALQANNTWKKEIVSKKINELNEKSLSLIEKIEETLDFSYMRYCYDNFEPENDYAINFHPEFFKEIREKIGRLKRQLVLAKEDVKFLNYFYDLAEKYSKKKSDCMEYPECLYCDDEWLDCFIKDCCKQNEDGDIIEKPLIIEIKQKINEAKVYYENKIMEFYIIKD